ncbi:MAG TPA: RraA family protein [Planctomycetota bacterium]|nr:RraA family protein [Planctomycetota bacterium]
MKGETNDLLNAFSTVRVADVRDGMDTMMLHHAGSMWPSIRPLFRTRAVGIARTVRYLPYDGVIPSMNPDEYWEWVGTYYRDVCPYPWMDEIEPGDFIVIDASGVNAGLMGSCNTLEGVKRGAAGYVSNGGVRDTDEIILQEVPFWSQMISQSMAHGRLRYDTRNVPVSVGGVTVHPGDVVVADGDGVVVVPRALALNVAEYANAEHRRDMENRRRFYDELGRKPDDTVAER